MQNVSGCKQKELDVLMICHNNIKIIILKETRTCLISDNLLSTLLIAESIHVGKTAHDLHLTHSLL